MAVTPGCKPGLLGGTGFDSLATHLIDSLYEKMSKMREGQGLFSWGAGKNRDQSGAPTVRHLPVRGRVVQGVPTSHRLCLPGCRCGPLQARIHVQLGTSHGLTQDDEPSLATPQPCLAWDTGQRDGTASPFPQMSTARGVVRPSRRRHSVVENKHTSGGPARSTEAEHLSSAVED